MLGIVLFEIGIVLFVVESTSQNLKKMTHAFAHDNHKIIDKLVFDIKEEKEL